MLKEHEYIIDISDFKMVKALFRTDVGKVFSIISLLSIIKPNNNYQQLEIIKHFGTSIKIRFKEN